MLVLCLVVGICSTVSHLTVGWLKIKAGWGGYKYYGPAGLKVAGILYSSSPGYDGIDWNLVAEAIGGGIESWATAGSSPSEWEEFPKSEPKVKYTFIAVSAHDLNEYFLSDFRADIVPFNRTLRDLRQCGADWQFSKRMLSQYPAMLVRKLFPTVGRSDGVMVGIRAKLLEVGWAEHGCGYGAEIWWDRQIRHPRAGQRLDRGSSPTATSFAPCRLPGETVLRWSQEARSSSSAAASRRAQ